MRRDELATSADVAFRKVGEACREGREQRWLTDPLLDTLTELNGAGWAHSVEVWRGDELVGGAMGIGLGGVFSGDSLFGRQPGAAAIACSRRSFATTSLPSGYRFLGRSIPAISKWSVLNPAFTWLNPATVRRNNPAPITSSVESAIWKPTSALPLIPFRRRVAVCALSFMLLLTSARAADQAGARPNRIPVSNVTAAVKANTPQSK